MTTPLFKYSLLDNSQGLSAIKNEFVVKLPKTTMDPTLHPCIFFATDGNMNTYTAHDYLALTYYPRSCYRYDVNDGNAKLEDNMGKNITNEILNTRYEAALRCWPSFGQPGGAREVIFIADSKPLVLKDPVKINSFLDGGETDEFHQDNTANYEFTIAEAIAKIIVSALQNNESIPLYSNDNMDVTIGSFNPESGLTINRQLKGGKFISISTGFTVYGYSMRIKMWATVWQDDERIKIRYIYGPLEREITFSLHYCNIPAQDNCINVKKAFTKLIVQHHYPYWELSGMISDLIKNGVQITDGFFKLRALSFSLR